MRITKEHKITREMLERFSKGRMQYTDEDIGIMTETRLELREAAQRDSYGGARFGDKPITKR